VWRTSECGRGGALLLVLLLPLSRLEAGGRVGAKWPKVGRNWVDLKKETGYRKVFMRRKRI
jgi:hypothetical protein